MSFNKTIGILSLLLLCSCNYLGKQQTKEIIAIVNDHVLYEEDVKNILPSNLTKEDSTVFVRAYIEDWAMDNILMDNAKFNLPLNEQERYQKMVDKYKSELFKKAYLDALIQQQSANKSIDSSSIAEYYELNKTNFKLNETLVKIRYVYAKNTLKDFTKIKKSFRRFDATDRNYLLDNELKFDKIELNDSVWVKITDVFKILNDLDQNQQKKVLKDKNTIQFQDSIGTYFIKVNDILKPNSVAPFSYIKPTIEQILKNKEKLKIKAELERKILNDAIKDKTYEILK